MRNQIVVKMSGSREDITKVVRYIEDKFYPLQKSNYMRNEKESQGEYHFYMTLLLAEGNEEVD